MQIDDHGNGNRNGNGNESGDGSEDGSGDFKRAFPPGKPRGAGESPPGEIVRLQKFLALCGLGARRKMEEVISAGRVTVNGVTAMLGAKVNVEADSIKLDGRRLRLPDDHIYLALHKPPHTLSSVSDDRQRPLVMELIPEKFRHRVHPVGRLDFDSEGLLLFTTDGALTLKLTHPRYKLFKTYWVKIRGAAKEKDLDKIRRGMVIEGRRTLPLLAQPMQRKMGKSPTASNSWLEVRMLEGRKNQIRELFFRIGHPVIRLIRQAVGPVVLGPLPPGECRRLSPEEVAALKNAPPAQVPVPPPKRAVPPPGEQPKLLNAGNARSESRPSRAADRPASRPSRPARANDRTDSRPARPARPHDRPDARPARSKERPSSADNRSGAERRIKTERRPLRDPHKKPDRFRKRSR